MTVEERFWHFVPSRPDEPTECWEWLGAFSGRAKKTPVFRVATGRMTTATRFAWCLEHRRPGRKNVSRACRNFRCVRPSHLKIGRERPVRRGYGVWGEKNANSKLTDEQVWNLRVLYERGASQSQLARYFSITQPAVSLLVHGQSRAAAGGPIQERQAA